MARPCHRQCGVYIRRPQIRNKQSASAEDIQRQKTVVVVIAVMARPCHRQRTFCPDCRARGHRWRQNLISAHRAVLQWLCHTIGKEAMKVSTYIPAMSPSAFRSIRFSSLHSVGGEARGISSLMPRSERIANNRSSRRL